MTQIDPGHAAQVVANILDAMGGKADTTLSGTSIATPKATSVPSSGGGDSTSAGTWNGQLVGSRDQDGFYQALLSRLGMPVNDANMTLMRAWNQAEGMDAGHFNPFATTQYADGASSINSVGVKHYTSMEQGVEATAQTLQNGQYAGILDGLAQSDPAAAAQGIANSPWGTGHLVQKILGTSG